MASTNNIRTLTNIWGITFAGQPSAGDYFYAADGEKQRKYTFRAAEVVATDLLIGGSLALTLANAVVRINADTGRSVSATSYRAGAGVDTLCIFPKNANTNISVSNGSGTNIGVPTPIDFLVIGAKLAMHIYIPWCSFVENYHFHFGAGTNDTFDGGNVGLKQGSGWNGQETLIATAYTSATLVSLTRAGGGVPILAPCTTAPTGMPYWKIEHSKDDTMFVSLSCNANGHDQPTKGSI